MSDSCYRSHGGDFRSSSSRAHPTRIEKVCQHKSVQGAKTENDLDFPGRLKKAFGGASNAEIARRLGYKSQSPVTKFMSGTYPGPEVLIEIARVTKVNVHWLLTGENEESVDPLRSLPENVRALLEKMAESEEKNPQQLLVEVVEQSLVDRCAAIMRRYPDLDPSELKLMPFLFALFDTSEEKEVADERISVSPSDVSRKKVG